VDYPDYAVAVGKAVLGGTAERGILICGSGVGASVAANKLKGIRAGLCHDTYSAHQGVEHDQMNVLVLGARVIGPAIAGILVASIGEGWCFFLNAVSYVAVIVGLLLMRVTWQPGKFSGSPLENIVEGFQYVRSTQPIRLLLLLLGLVSLVGMPYAVLMPIFADRILHRGANGLGILMGATGVGALIGALTLAFKRGLRGLGSWVMISSAGFGASLILFGISKNFWLSVALLVPVGYCMMVEMASSNTLIQSMVPDRLRGRVMSVYSMMFMGMAPIGALGAGVVAHHLGAPLTVAIGGMACMLGSVAFGMRLPVMRMEARRLILAQGLAGGDPPQEIVSQEVSEKA